MNNGRRWTAREDEYLRDHYGWRTSRQIGSALDRTPGAVQVRARLLELGSPGKTFWAPTPEEIEAECARLREGREKAPPPVETPFVRVLLDRRKA